MMFSKEECEKIISLSNTIPSEKSKKYFPNENEINYSVWNIYRTTETDWIFEKLFIYFTNETGIKIKNKLDIVHLHNYKKGNKFKKHKDNLYPTQIHNIGVCLNDDYEGGEFVLYEPDFILPKKQGSIYTFESLRSHEVKEITEGERWSIIAFLHTDNLEFVKRGLL